MGGVRWVGSTHPATAAATSSDDTPAASSRSCASAVHFACTATPPQGRPNDATHVSLNPGIGGHIY